MKKSIILVVALVAGNAFAGSSDFYVINKSGKDITAKLGNKQIPLKTTMKDPVPFGNMNKIEKLTLSAQTITPNQGGLYTIQTSGKATFTPYEDAVHEYPKMRNKVEAAYLYLESGIGVYIINVSSSYDIKVKETVISSSTIAPNTAKWVIMRAPTQLTSGGTVTLTAVDRGSKIAVSGLTYKLKREAVDGKDVYGYKIDVATTKCIASTTELGFKQLTSGNPFFCIKSLNMKETETNEAVKKTKTKQ